MAVLKAPLKQPKTTPIQLRLDDEARANLTKYAEFLDSSPSYGHARERDLRAISTLWSTPRCCYAGGRRVSRQH
jgi:hypothetical protein